MSSPAYHRLYVLLSEQIRDGVYLPDDRLPSENQLAETYSCSRVTVRHALKLLSQDGLVEKRKGHGTIVRLPSPYTSDRLRGPVSEIVASGIQLRARELFWGEVIPPRQEADALQLDTGESCLRVRRVRYFDGEPVSYSSIYVPSHVGELLAHDEAGEKLILELLEATPYRPVDTEHTLTATVADGDVAKELRLAVGSPVLRMRGLAHDEQGDPIYFQESLYHSAKFEYAVRLTRGVATSAPEWRPAGPRRH
ncbi:MAG: GntR family transcriptional regulator [Gammaproteobacteria bacterium]|nr:GntR family transcriptional regulator [Gammaproteobacteria bacterium]